MSLSPIEEARAYRWIIAWPVYHPIEAEAYVTAKRTGLTLYGILCVLSVVSGLHLARASVLRVYNKLRVPNIVSMHSIHRYKYLSARAFPHFALKCDGRHLLGGVRFAVHEPLEVHHRASDHHRNSTARQDVVDSLLGSFDEIT